MNFYRFADGLYQAETEIKRSKFIATLKGEIYGDEAEQFVAEVRKKYSDATHNCYAYTGDLLGNLTRFSDDGEPGGTAGQPMLEVLKKQELYGTAVVVTRYFGGIKLGAGGLVGAYTDAVSQVLKKAKIGVKTLCAKINIKADYATFAIIENYFRRQNILIENITYSDWVEATVFVEQSLAEKTINEISALTCGIVRSEISGTQYKKIN